MTAIPSPLLSVNDAAAYLGISRASLYRLAAELGTGKTGLPVVRIGGRRLFKRSDLDALIARSTYRSTA